MQKSPSLTLSKDPDKRLSELASLLNHHILNVQEQQPINSPEAKALLDLISAELGESAPPPGSELDLEYLQALRQQLFDKIQPIAQTPSTQTTTPHIDTQPSVATTSNDSNRIDKIKQLFESQRQHQQKIVQLHQTSLRMFKTVYLQKYGHLANASTIFSTLEPQFRHAISAAISKGAQNPYQIINLAQQSLEIPPQFTANAAQIPRAVAARTIQDLKPELSSSLASSPAIKEALTSQNSYQQIQTELAKTITQDISKHLEQIKTDIESNAAPPHLEPKLNQLKAAARSLNPAVTIIKELQNRPITSIDIDILESHLTTPESKAVLEVIKSDTITNKSRSLSPKEAQILTHQADQLDPTTQAINLLQEISGSHDPSQIKAALDHVSQIVFESSAKHQLAQTYLSQGHPLNSAHSQADKAIKLILTHHQLSAAPQTTPELQHWLEGLGISSSDSATLTAINHWLQQTQSANILSKPSAHITREVFAITQGDQDQLNHLLNRFSIHSIDPQSLSKLTQLLQSHEVSLPDIIQNFGELYSHQPFSPYNISHVLESFKPANPQNITFYQFIRHPFQSLRQLFQFSPSSTGLTINQASGGMSQLTSGFRSIGNLFSAGGKLGSAFSKLSNLFKGGIQKLSPVIGSGVKAIGSGITAFGGILQGAGAAAVAAGPWIVGGIVVLILITVIIQGTKDASDGKATYLGGAMLENPSSATPPGEKIAGTCWPLTTGSITETPDGHDRRGDMSNGGSAIDIGVPEGTPIYSPFEGDVVFAGWNTTGYGNMVRIHVALENQQEFDLIFAHLNRVLVHSGEQIRFSNDGISPPIGISGNTGNSSGPHLHYEAIGINIRDIIPFESGSISQACP